MKQGNDFMVDMLDFDRPAAEQDVLWRAYKPTAVQAVGGDAILTVPFQAQKGGLRPVADETVAQQVFRLRLRAYGDAAGGAALRLSIAFDGELWEESVMLAVDPSLTPQPLAVTATESGWDICDGDGVLRAQITTAEPPTRPWGGTELPEPQETLVMTLYPDGETTVPLSAYDQFFPPKVESLPLAFVTRAGQPDRALFSFHADPRECFAGTGERFAKLDLAGRTLVLENTDALGVNNRRAYKNVPFYLSSRPYGLFMHTPSHVRLSLADVSTRAAQGLIEEPVVDLFVIGGGSVERVLYNYRRLTGFPPEVPLWSYGTWMSRMTYFSADEVREIAARLREGDFPCDVLHLDTGWFAKDWICEWEFSKERFPDPAGFMEEMREQGFRITLWQTPNIGPGNRLLEEAKANRYLAPLKAEDAEAQLPEGVPADSESDFSAQGVAGQIDFSNPEAVAWYQGLLARLLEMGASAIKTDFGENLDFNGDFAGLPAEQLHNLYGLLYQRAAFEVTKETTGDGIIWARTSWAGCQRYPVHWGGDAACTWDGMAGSLRGGLHLGLSGFGYWSHDVPGFHGVPDFMASWPTDDLYVRWTQFGVFTSHLRYHGTTPREPYEYPEVADIVRRWLKLRYALIPYLLREAGKTTRTGLPVLRALILHHEDDPLCWHIDDAYYVGDDLLVAPVMNAAGVRDVYLPAGSWVDLWTGDRYEGPTWLKDLQVPLAQMPVYARYGAEIPVYPEPVASTQEMDLAKTVNVVFDDTYESISSSVLGEITGM
jgi:alpha-D-xyloside xylohydrolase